MGEFLWESFRHLSEAPLLSYLVPTAFSHKLMSLSSQLVLLAILGYGSYLLGAHLLDGKTSRYLVDKNEPL